MIRRLIALALIMGTVLSTIPRRLSAAGPWYVSPDGSDSNNCLSWAAACRTIEKALTLAGAGDTIYIAAGTYAENVLFVNGENLVGSGAGVTAIDAGGAHQVMSVSGVAILSGLTLRNRQASDGGASITPAF